ncbi:MAG: YMGG-like glycine zipper-containing protein [Gemmatimonadaceae bacterium]
MTKFIRITVAPLALVALIAACGKSDDAAADSRQVELAPAAAGQPQLGDTAQAAEAPAAAKVATAPKPAPAKAAPAPTKSVAPAPVAAPTTGTIAAGTLMNASSATRVCTNIAKVGDRVNATLADAVTGTNGVSVPAGATVTLRVSEAKRGENGKEGIRLAFEPVAVSYDGTDYDISGTATVPNIDVVRAQSTADQAKKVAIGAAAGAIVGQIIGKKTKPTVVGAAVGAAAGGAVAMGSADWNGCLAQGGRVAITLAGPLTVRRVP